MSREIERAREKAVSAAVSLVSTRLFIDTNMPSQWDDADMELATDQLDEALNEWAILRHGLIILAEQ